MKQRAFTGKKINLKVKGRKIKKKWQQNVGSLWYKAHAKQSQHFNTVITKLLIQHFQAVACKQSQHLNATYCNTVRRKQVACIWARCCEML